MLSRDADCGAPQSNYKAWTDAVGLVCGRYRIDPAEGDFAGWVRPLNGSGFTALDVGCTVDRIERTQRDIRMDGIDHYSLLFQVAGSCRICQGDRVAKLTPGDVVLLDKAQPLIQASEDVSRCSASFKHWFALHLPRHRLISHLGNEPAGGIGGQGGPRTRRLLYDLALSAIEEEEATSPPAAEGYLQLAIYDLVGAMFVSEPWSLARPSDKLFNRMRRVIGNNFTDPDFGPREVASEMGISPRYVHKLFAERGGACSEYIWSLRLDHAAQLLRRRPLLGTRQPLSMVAYACGFRDYTHFARKFRQRFGHAPGALAEGLQ
jgi:AraC family transcriptional regulator, positive regulator of tynA and feaB